MKDLVNKAIDFPSQDLEHAAENSLNALIARLHECQSALRFYARHEHWMAGTEDPDDLRRILVAMAGDGKQHGWLVAERVLAKEQGDG